MSKQPNSIDRYSETISWLFEQFPSYQVIGSKAYKPTLENTRKLLTLLGNPQDQLKFIHVAGSNGKGSTCSMLASALTEVGYNVGLFTSPHIEDFTERVRVNGVPIDRESVIHFVEQIRIANLDFAPSFFEITFALALDYFLSQQCDIAVIETGLGGRLDATNIITPLLSVITNISLEHTHILGDTLELIAAEKAGIIKEGVPIITAEKKAAIQTIFRTKAQQLGASFVLSNTEAEIPNDFPLLGEYQQENFHLVSSTLSELRKMGFRSEAQHLERGLSNLQQNSGFRARLQIWKRDPLTLLDVSHNPDGIEKTMQSVQKINQGKLHIIYGTSSDKTIADIISVFQEDASMYFTKFSNPRSASTEQLKQAVNSKQFESVHFFPKSSEAYRHAQNTAKQNDTILIIGSFFLIADFF